MLTDTVFDLVQSTAAQPHSPATCKVLFRPLQTSLWFIVSYFYNKLIHTLYPQWPGWAHVLANIKTFCAGRSYESSDL